MNCFLNLFIIFTTIYNFLCYTTAVIFPNSNANIALTNTNKMPLTGHDINPLVQHSLTPTVFKDLSLATDLTKVYHHGFDN